MLQTTLSVLLSHRQALRAAKEHGKAQREKAALLCLARTALKWLDFGPCCCAAAWSTHCAEDGHRAAGGPGRTTALLQHRALLLCAYLVVSERGEHQSRLETETREELALLCYRAATSIIRDEACSECCVKP